MRRDSCEVRQLLASHRWLFRHQPILHVCGNAELSGFSDGFGSLQSGRQLFGLGQSLGGPASPIVAIEIVSLDFCHVIVLTRRTRVAVLPPNSIAHHRAGVQLRLVVNLHSVHRRVRYSNPERAEVLCWTSMGDCIWDNEATPPGEAITRAFLDLA